MSPNSSSHVPILGLAAGLCLAVSCTSTPTIPRPAGTGAGTILTFAVTGSAEAQISGTTQELNSVAFGGVDGGGLFVVVGAAGTILTSPDAVHWTEQASPTQLDLYGVVYGNDRFIAVGGNDVAAAGVVLTGSADGTHWSTESISDSLTLPFSAVTFPDGQFVAVGINQVMTSADGATWTALPTQPSGITGPTVDLFDTAYGNSLYVTVGTYNTSTSTQEIAYDGIIATSPDAIRWTILPYASNYLAGVTYGGGQFVAVGREGLILTSADGTTWTPQSVAQLDSSKTPYLEGVVYANGIYVIAGDYVGVNPSTGFLLTSADGKSWTLDYSGDNLYAVAHGVVASGGVFVAVGGE